MPLNLEFTKRLDSNHKVPIVLMSQLNFKDKENIVSVLCLKLSFSDKMF